jgi:hypothetical protein
MSGELSIDLCFTSDPTPILTQIREAKLTPGRLTLRSPEPKNSAEENYLLLFEEFLPLCSGERIHRGAATAAATATAETYPIERLAIPTEPILPVTGEFLQSLCDYSVLNREKATEKYVWVDAVCPPERQLLIEKEWPPEVFEAKSLFLYPMEDNCVSARVFSHAWPRLRLVVFHNSDFSMDVKGIESFLECNPNVCVWAANAHRWHPRIRPLPLGEENRVWRGGSLTYEPPLTVSRNPKRSIEICLPYWGYTHPARELWRKEAESLDTYRLYKAAKMPKDEYLEFVTTCRAMLCPRGNGFDTHRVWECLLKGTWPIVEDNAHTHTLLRQYPSLPLLPIDSPENLDMSGLDLPEGLPLFHPMLLREYWRVLFNSHVA